MDRERWQSYPVGTAADRKFLARLAKEGAGDERTVTVENAAGVRRALEVRCTVEVEEPAAGRGSVVCRVEFQGGGPREDERVVENLWLVASEYLDAAEARARAEAPAPKKVSKKPAAAKRAVTKRAPARKKPAPKKSAPKAAVRKAPAKPPARKAAPKRKAARTARKRR